jgi:hypothetical protein
VGSNKNVFCALTIPQLKVVNKYYEFSIVHVLFADDAELTTESQLELELQHFLNVFSEVVSGYSQEISVKKTEVLVVQPRVTRCHVEEPCRMQAEADDTNEKVGTVLVYGKPLEVVSEFKYVGSIANKFTDTHDEIRTRRQRAGQAYAKVAENIFENAILHAELGQGTRPVF